MKASGSQKLKKYYFVQVGDVLFYRFLLELGLTVNKTKTLGGLRVPDEYFFDFLRGHFDGDGSFYSYWDPRWKSSFMFYMTFVSASKNHIDWIREKINEIIHLNGCVTNHNNLLYQLKYAKKESLELISRIYHGKNVICLPRKRLKIESALKIQLNARVVKLAYTHP